MLHNFNEATLLLRFNTFDVIDRRRDW